MVLDSSQPASQYKLNHTHLLYYIKLHIICQYLFYYIS
nr:MAG TPA: hypothetical protein [Caudoviricetes sp.]